MYCIELMALGKILIFSEDIFKSARSLLSLEEFERPHRFLWSPEEFFCTGFCGAQKSLKGLEGFRGVQKGFCAGFCGAQKSSKGLAGFCGVWKS